MEEGASGSLYSCVCRGPSRASPTLKGRVDRPLAEIKLQPACGKDTVYGRKNLLLWSTHLEIVIFPRKKEIGLNLNESTK